MTLDKPKCKLAYKPGFVCSTFLLFSYPFFSYFPSIVCGFSFAFAFAYAFIFIFCCFCFLFDRSVHLFCMWQAFACLSHIKSFNCRDDTVQDMSLETLGTLEIHASIDTEQDKCLHYSSKSINAVIDNSSDCKLIHKQRTF